MVSKKFTLGRLNKEYIICKCATIVHLKEVGGQDWVRFGLRGFLMTPRCYTIRCA